MLLGIVLRKQKKFSLIKNLIIGASIILIIGLLLFFI